MQSNANQNKYIMHEFIIKEQGELHTYTRWEDIPKQFDHVIKFVPGIPPEPHTEEQHKEIDSWNTRLKELMQRERSYASSD